MNKITVKKLIANNRKFYDAAADKFSSTRLFPWRDFDFLKSLVGPGVNVLDLGCGNGRFYQYLKDSGIKYLGVDNSKKLIAKARSANLKANFETANIINYKTKKKFNLILMIAAIHHIPSSELRQKVLKNIHGMLNKDGILVISCWNLWTPRYIKYITKKDGTKIDSFILDKNDALITFSDGKKLIGKRYLHAFQEKELIAAVKKAHLMILKNLSNNKNFTLILKKQ